MDVKNAVQYDRHSFWGKIFFAYYKRIWGYAPDRTDSCYVRKVVFFLAPWSWFFKSRLLGTGVKPWHIFTVAVYALLAYMYAYPMAVLTFSLLSTILVGIVIAALLLLYMWLKETTYEWREIHLIAPLGRFKWRLRDRMVKAGFNKALAKFGHRVVAVNYLALLIALILTIVGTQIYAHIVHNKWAFYAIVWLEIAAVVILLIAIAHYLYTGSSFKEKVDYAIARSIAKPVKNTWRIAFDWYEDIKSHVCKPVVWVDTNKTD